MSRAEAAHTLFYYADVYPASENEQSHIGPQILLVTQMVSID